jgi:quercetin dioxygenase-like cupin family protein
MTTTEHRRRGITVFRAADATDLGATDFMTAPTMSDETKAALGSAVVEGSNAGASVKVLIRQSNDDGGFGLVHVWLKPHYPLPRHTHDADCMYYVISGTAIMGNQTLRAGDGFFVPTGAPYQYAAGADGVEVLEIRHNVDRFDMDITDDLPARWDAMRAAALANREDWNASPVSPTFEANARG